MEGLGFKQREEERKGHWPDSCIYQIYLVRDGRWSERPLNWMRHSERGREVVWLGEQLASEAFSPRGFSVSVGIRKEKRAIYKSESLILPDVSLPSDRILTICFLGK